MSQFSLNLSDEDRFLSIGEAKEVIKDFLGISGTVFYQNYREAPQFTNLLERIGKVPKIRKRNLTKFLSEPFQ